MIFCIYNNAYAIWASNVTIDKRKQLHLKSNNNVHLCYFFKKLKQKEFLTDVTVAVGSN